MIMEVFNLVLATNMDIQHLRCCDVCKTFLEGLFIWLVLYHRFEYIDLYFINVAYCKYNTDAEHPSTVISVPRYHEGQVKSVL